MIQVQKADGSLEPFNELKIRSTLKRASVDDIAVNFIIHTLKGELYDGIPTEKIYQRIFKLLSAGPRETRYRYNLKRAIMDLGPTGYPFELFVAGVLQHFGYQTETNVMASGKCISHEIDVVASKDGKKMMIECKFHNHLGTKSGIRTALYTYARFLDTKDVNHFSEAWLATNTKVTSEAVDYANCTGMKIIAWNYPEDFSLRLLIEKSNLHPITARDDLTQNQKNELFRRGIVFLRDLEKN